MLSFGGCGISCEWCFGAYSKMWLWNDSKLPVCWKSQVTKHTKKPLLKNYWYKCLMNWCSLIKPWLHVTFLLIKWTMITLLCRAIRHQLPLMLINNLVEHSQPHRLQSADVTTTFPSHKPKVGLDGWNPRLSLKLWQSLYLGVLLNSFHHAKYLSDDWCTCTDLF